MPPSWILSAGRFSAWRQNRVHRDRIQGGVLGCYPRDELASRHFVFPQDPHDPGILYLPPVIVVPKVEFPRDEYEGIARPLVELLHQRWLQHPADFEAKYTPRARQAVADYASDLEAYEKAELQAEIEVELQILPPTPPRGYHRQQHQIGGAQAWVLGVGEEPPE